VEAASVSVKLNDEEAKFENCVQLDVDNKAVTLTSRMCRSMDKFFICQIAGICHTTALHCCEAEPNRPQCGSRPSVRPSVRLCLSFCPSF